jgi:secreted trypsin-like serine protease
MKLFFPAVMCLLLVACGQSKNENKYVNSTDQSAIIGGKKVADGAPISASIVGIFDSENQFTCTGTLLENNIVLTAAHCIEAKNPSKIAIVFSNELMKTVTAREVDILQNFVRHATSTRVHPGYNEKINETKNTDWNDLALIKFSGLVPEGYHPATFLTDASLLKKGASIKLAGYGVTSVDTVEINPKKYKKIDEAIESGSVVCDDDQHRSHCYKIDFNGDDELYETTAPIEGLSESEVRTDESEHGTCVGDSGGPAYLEKDGINYFFGITSRGSVACDATGVYTNALVFKTWIEDTAKSLK